MNAGFDPDELRQVTQTREATQPERCLDVSLDPDETGAQDCGQQLPLDVREAASGLRVATSEHLPHQLPGELVTGEVPDRVEAGDGLRATLRADWERREHGRRMPGQVSPVPGLAGLPQSTRDGGRLEHVPPHRG